MVSEDCGGGCGITNTGTANNYGPAFNNNGGGWCVRSPFIPPPVLASGHPIATVTTDRRTYRYAMERTSAFIKVWFWQRTDASVPADLAAGAGSIDTDSWVRGLPPPSLSFSAAHVRADLPSQGEPVALFPNTSCDLDTHFGANNIIINLTLCGDWAGQAAIFNGAGCPGACAGQSFRPQPRSHALRLRWRGR